MPLDSYASVHHNPHCSPLPTHGPGTHFYFLLPSVGAEDMVPALDGGETLKSFWNFTKVPLDEAEEGF